MIEDGFGGVQTSPSHRPQKNISRDSIFQSVPGDSGSGTLDTLQTDFLTNCFLAYRNKTRKPTQPICFQCKNLKIFFDKFNLVYKAF